MKRGWILLVFCLLPLMAAANDTIIIKRDSGVEIIERGLDSLLHNWYVAKLLEDDKPESEYLDESIEAFSDSVYKERLENIHSVVSLPYNSIVKNHIHVYTGRKKRNFRIMLGMSEYYFPMIEDIFDSYGLPTELKYMAVIESALNPNAVSRVGATGLWQFMYSTGRQYGLTINSVVDERRDPVKATHAAARYLKDLYRVYNDWGLVIAAYNCGPGNVNKAIRRSGKQEGLLGDLLQVTPGDKGLFARYIAATYAMTYHEEHHIKPKAVTFPLATDTIMINQDLHLRQISDVLNLPYGELRALNPQYRTSLVPGKSRPMPLTLPINRVGDFISLQDSIVAYKADYYLKTASKSASPTRSTYTPPDIQGKTKLIYVVKEGDNLGFIASWYNVGLSNVRYWNNIYRNTIRVGQKINVFVDPSKKDYYAAVNKLSFEEKQKRIGKKVSSPVVKATPEPENAEYIYYTVRSGDTVWDIAKKFEGVSTSDILALNGMSSSSRINAGQKLKIKRRT